jgi:hypothetical protein
MEMFYESATAVLSLMLAWALASREFTKKRLAAELDAAHRDKAQLLTEFRARCQENADLEKALELARKAPAPTQELTEFLQDIKSGVGFVRVHPIDVILRSPRDRS